MFLQPAASSITLFRRSSKSPRYFAPASIAVRSSAKMRLPISPCGTFPAATRCAKPSTTAVLPTPASPIRQGLFLQRRRSTRISRSVSFSRPITGSRAPFAAISVRSLPYFVRAGNFARRSFSVARSGSVQRWAQTSPASFTWLTPRSDNMVWAQQSRSRTIARRRCSGPALRWFSPEANDSAFSISLRLRGVRSLSESRVGLPLPTVSSRRRSTSFLPTPYLRSTAAELKLSSETSPYRICSLPT
ncbi:putative uncharacterized protein [Eubacterium sp. CAG:786]|nr:putative uncharacterized protein [Eubacterium sp. CAG:786]